MGASYDICRYVRGERFYYIRNFAPQWPWGNSRTMDKVSRACARGRICRRRASFTQRRPVLSSTQADGELYDMQTDPFQSNNLAANPSHQKQLRKLRTECVAWMKRVGDLAC